MEPKLEYLTRFLASDKMTDLFPDATQRQQMAAQTFADKWEDALVRVTKLDGTQFFID